jgi:hypothetical protein
MLQDRSKRFRQLAADALAEAALLTDPTTKRLLIEIAASYERLADRTQWPEATKPPTDTGELNV